MRPLSLLLAAACAASAFAWTSPGDGTAYDPEALVAASGGALTGAWPDYLQAQDVELTAPDTLRWPAGTGWLAADGVELRVHGALLAPGTPWEPVVVAAQSGVPGAWSGLILDDAGASGALRCVTISGGEDGLNCLSSSPLLEHCTLAGNFGSGLHCFLDSSPTLRRCTIEGNSQYGVEITGGCSPVLEHCVIRGNNVEGASPRNAVAIGIQGTNSPRLTACRLEGLGPANPASGFSLWMSGDPRLAACEITGFRSGAVIQGSGAQGRLEGCWIHGNRYADPLLGGSGVNVNSSAAPVLRGCAIEDNDWGVTLTSACAPDFGAAADPGAGRLHGNGNGGAVWDFYNNAASAVDARGNWWGTTDPALIELHVHDDGDGAFGAVHVDPIREDSLFAPWLSPRTGFHALAAGQALALRPADHFRPTSGLEFALEGPGAAQLDGDSLRWTPPADGDTLLTLLLRATAPGGPSTVDTLFVWLRRSAGERPLLAIALAGAAVRLEWSAVPGASAYRVERAADPRFPAGGVEVVAVVAEPSCLDAGALERPRACYRVVALLPD